MAKKLEELIREEAKVNGSRYNLAQFASKREHHRICKNLVQLADEHNFPMGVLVYIAVGTNAHRLHIFEKGYNHFDSTKAEKVIKLCSIIDKKLNNGIEKKVNYRTNDRIVHLCSRYYDVNKGNEMRLRQILNKADLPKVQAYIKTKNPTAKVIAQMLFSDDAVFNEKDGNKTYMISVKKN